MNRLAVLCCVCLLVTAGFAPIVAGGHPHTADSDSSHTATTDSHEPSIASVADTGDFNSGPLGCVNGICHDDELNLDQADGLSAEELQTLVYRSMARVEELRGERFEADVPVNVMSREEFREERGHQNRSAEFDRWNDQVWKALFVVGADERANEEIDETVGSAVAGFYRPSTNEVVIITPEPESPQINERTLVHELAHALQDQRHDLTQSKYRGATQDADLAVTGVYEGEVVYLESKYEARCEEGRWECLDEPPRNGASGSPNQGLLLLLLQPYSDGPAYVADIIEEEGWTGVDARMEHPPTTTTEIIHRKPVESQPIELADTATAGWEQYSDQGIGGAEVTGEASLFVMFWYQASTYGAETIDPSIISETSHPNERRNYVSEPSNGWVSDELYPYRRGDDDGYVWALEWETADDAAEFQRAYGAILAAHDATQTDSGVYVVDDGGFSGAYAVAVDETRVTIVHAPTADGVFELAPGLDPEAITHDSVPGFGAGVSLAALALAAAVFRRLAA